MRIFKQCCPFHKDLYAEITSVAKVSTLLISQTNKKAIKYQMHRGKMLIKTKHICSLSHVRSNLSSLFREAEIDLLRKCNICVNISNFQFPEFAR